MSYIKFIRRLCSKAQQKTGSRRNVTKKDYGKIFLATSLALGGGVAWSAYKIHHLSDQLKEEIAGVLGAEKELKSYIYIKQDHKYPPGPGDDVARSKHVAHRDKPAPFFSWAYTYGHDPWMLLKLAKSQDHSVRLLATKALADLHHMHDADYVMLAQASDQRTMIGLARSQDVDLRYFLPPPKLPNTKDPIEDSFRKLLSNLPTSGVDPCTNYFTSSAIQAGNVALADDRGGLWCFGGNGLAFAQSLSTVPEMRVELFCLQALMSHSAVPYHRAQIVSDGGLQLLNKIYLERQGSVPIQRLIARIIANLSLQEDLHSVLVASGWVGIAAKWLQSEDLALTVHAARALANLDRDFGLQKYEDGVCLYHPQFRSSAPVYADIVFVHGLLGGAFKTWRQQDRSKMNGKEMVEEKEEEEEEEVEEKSMSEEANGHTMCWPKDWLAKDCPNVRLLTVEYETYLSDWAPKCPFENNKSTIAARSGEILQKLMQAGLGNRPIIWVGHSMGGLVIKQILVMAAQDPSLREIYKKTSGVVFYSVPHRGSALAQYSTQAQFLLYPSVEVKELAQDSKLLKNLDIGFKQLMFHKGTPILSLGETQKTDIGLKFKVLIVPPESSDLGFGEYHLVDTDHIYISKPHSKASPIYKYTLEFIQDCIPQDRIENIIGAGIQEDYVLPDDL